MKKRLIATLLCGLLLTGCGATSAPAQTQPVPGAAEETAQAAQEETPAGTEQTKETDMENTAPEETVADETAATTAEPSEQSLVPDIVMEPMKPDDNEAMAMARAMKLGWNLGNTLDAYNDGNLTDPMSTETCWGNPKANQELIKGLHAAGVETIRIPISWHNHVDAAYNVDPQWMTRVKEVVDYAYDEGMYVIINIHHDNHPEANGIYPDEAHREQSLKYITSIWTQVAETFKDYDEHLLFEAMNEPRLVGHTNEWWIDTGNADCTRAVEIINELNQKFVDVVRSSGGNNGQRFLMCPGYCASPDGVLNAGFKIPEDTVENRLILSVHAYTPYSFALEYPGINNFDNRLMASYKDIDDFMTKLYYKYVSGGMPIVIDEFGARDKSGNLEDRVRYAAYYTARARAYGMTVCWWDNGAFTGTGELFGLMNRDNGNVVYKDIMDAMVRYCE
ncbi:MAG: glycoside hydrolase family 5 protein [Lachnospiraceae bacterium]|nr:glycoside hydrolase family 5 protein [Lachnospiraceae bacterium]